MAQIEKKKKKGRPSKADLASRRATGNVAGVSPDSAAVSDDRRRSLRRKSFRYSIIDYDEDYENDAVSDLENNNNNINNNSKIFNNNKIINNNDINSGGKRRRGKKVKLVVKLSNGVESGGGKSRRGRVADSESEEDDDVEEEEDDVEERESKKVRSNGGNEDEDDEGEDEDEDEDEDNNGVEERDEKEEAKGKDEKYDAGTQNGNSSSKRSNVNTNTPLPDKKQLEVILDKLQKKDTYGVYSEPVDPEELPDYHDVIEHPMDFSTVRKKLANGAYSKLEQLETDVFLISSNAMQYNSPDTVYYRQASAIKELAERKFERVRMQIERLERESKSEVMCEPKVEQKERPYPLVKKQTKKPVNRVTQEPVGSDFSSGATLAMMDNPIINSAEHVGNFERPSNNHDGPLEGVSSLADSVLEKAEDSQSGKGALPKFGRRTYVVDENRRATYNISNQPEEKSESVFTTFDGEKKQLISVGLSGELSYARSLARYAANLGPMAWKVASKRIEQVLPQGSKYGRGWIGEYEPLPSPVLVFEHVKNPFSSRLCNAIDSRKEDRKDSIVDSKKDEKLSECHAQANVHLFNRPSSDGKMSAIFGSGGAKPPISTPVSHPKNSSSQGSQDRSFKGAELKFQSIITQQHNAMSQQQNLFPRETVCPENMGAKRVEPNSPSISDQKRDCFPPKLHSHGMEMSKKRVETDSPASSDQIKENVLQKQPHRVEIPASMPNETLPKGKNFLQSPPMKQPDANVPAPASGPRPGPDGLSNGKVANNFVGSNRVITQSQRFMAPHLAGAPVSFPLRQDQGLSDPVLVMKMMTEKFQRQQNGSVQGQSQSQPQARPSVPSPRGDTAAQAAASAWMSVGSGGFRPQSQKPFTQTPPTSRSQVSTDPFYNASTRMFYPQAMHFQPENTGLIPIPQSNKFENETQVQAHSRPMMFPQMVTNDLSRFQGQPPWRGLSPHPQQKQKSDTLPPDLNVAFQSTVDSQQPDLALQL